jgi:hypothetical protein
VAIGLVLASGACGALEGLDRYQPCEGDCDASVSGGPTDDAPRETSAATADAGDVEDEGIDDGAASEAATEADSAIGEAGGVDAGSTSCVCVASANAGWKGYVTLLLADGGTPACASPYGTALSALKLAPLGAAAACTACTCGFPSSGPITCQVDLGSAGAVCIGETMTAAPQGACVIPPGPVGLSSGPNGDSYGPTPIAPPSGSCAPTGGLAQPLAAPTWTSVGVCSTSTGAAQGTCTTSGQICVPAPEGQTASASGVCIYQQGDTSCPSGSYSQRFVASDSIDDTRGCTCACAPPACPTDGYVQGYTSINCTGTPATTFAADAGCAIGHNTNGSISFEYFPSHGTWNGTCAVSASGPDGGVSLDDAHAMTFCCVP